MPTLELYSVVALLRDIPEQHLSRGKVGTIVEIYSPNDAEVELVDTAGYTYGLTTLRSEDLIRLHHEPLTQVAA